MKKLLFASTALVASASIASAQDLGVALTGDAEMGIFDNGNDDVQFLTDLDVTFTMTGESDNGISFGATIDLDEATDSELSPDFETDGAQGGENMFVSFGGATLTMGDTDGALDARVPEMALAGSSLRDDETSHAGFDDGAFLDGAGDGQVARFDYTYSAFTFSLSAEQENNGSDVPVAGGTRDENNIYAVGVSYAGSFSGVDVTTGLGYQAQEDVAEILSLAATAGFANGLSVGATVSEIDLDNTGNDISHYGLGVGYEMGALAVGVNYGKFDQDNVGESEGYGLAATYDLGGGLSVQGGYGNSDPIGGGDFDTFSLGLNMSF